MYGYTDAHADAKAKEANNALFQLIMQDVQYRDLPFLIMGDFNSDLEDIQCVNAMVESGMLCDLTSMPHLTGQQAPLETCFAHSAKTHTRRDFMLIPRAILGWAQEVQVDPSEGFDMHAPVALFMKPYGNRVLTSMLKLKPLEKPDDLKPSEWSSLVHKSG